MVDVGCTKAEVFQRQARASKWPRDLLGRLGETQFQLNFVASKRSLSPS